MAKPEATIVITTNLDGYSQEFDDVYRGILFLFRKSNYLDNLTAIEKHRSTQESVCRMIEAARFTMAQMIHDECPLRFLEGKRFLNHVLTKIGLLPGWQAAVDGKDRERVFLALANELNNVPIKQDSPTMTVPMLYLEAIAS